MEDGKQLSGYSSLIRVQEILGSSPDRARMMQQDSTLIFKVFDRIDPTHLSQNRTQRRMQAVTDVKTLNNESDNFLTQLQRLICSLDEIMSARVKWRVKSFFSVHQ